MLWSQPIGTDLLGDKTKVEIPFKYQQGFILVDIELDRTLPLTFIFDTGAEHSILFHKVMADLIDLEYTKRMRILGSDLSNDVFALIVRNVFLEVRKSKLVKRDILVLENEISQLREALGLEINGILGSSFFKGMVVHINYRKKKLIIEHPTEFVPPKANEGYTIFDMKIASNKPYLNIPVQFLNDKTVDCRLLVDTGAGIPLLIHANTDTNIVLPDFLVDGKLGYGLGGAIRGYLGKVKNLKLKELQLDYPITSFQEIDMIGYEDYDFVRNGILGNKLLSRFDLILDYMNSKFYMKPRKGYNKEFAYDKSGMEVIALGTNLKDFYVKRVIPGTPAAEADIRAGDLIKRVGFFSSRFYSLEKLTKKLEGKVGKKIKLKIERDGERMTKKFRLRDFFKK